MLNRRCPVFFCVFFGTCLMMQQYIHEPYISRLFKKLFRKWHLRGCHVFGLFLLCFMVKTLYIAETVNKNTRY